MIRFTLIKKIIALILTVTMMFSIAACGTQKNNTNIDPSSQDVIIPDADKTARAEYYKMWAESDDFGVEGKFSSMDMSLNDVRFFMEITDTNMTISVGENEFALYELDKKAYVYIKTLSDGKVEEKWYVADIPDDAESMLDGDDEENEFSNGSNFDYVEYIDTVKEDGVVYDILNVKAADVFRNDENDRVYKIYVNADTHKMSRIELEEEIEDEEGNTAQAIKVIGTIKFIEKGPEFKAPENAEKSEYEELMMTFAFGMISILSENPELSSFMN